MFKVLGNAYTGNVPEVVIEMFDEILAIKAFLPFELNKGALHQFQMFEKSGEFCSLFWNEFKDLLLNNSHVRNLCYSDKVLFFGGVI